MTLSFWQNFEPHINHKQDDTDKTWLYSFLSERLIIERSMPQDKTKY